MADRATKKAVRFHFFDEYYDRARGRLGAIKKAFTRNIARPGQDGDGVSILFCGALVAGGLAAGGPGILAAGILGAGVIGVTRMAMTSSLKRRVKEEMNRDLPALIERYAAEVEMPDGLKKGFDAAATVSAAVSAPAAPGNEHDGLHL